MLLEKDKNEEIINKLIDLLNSTLENNTEINKKTLEIMTTINRRNVIKDSLIVFSLLSFFLIIYLF